MNISIVVVTHDREKKLIKLLESLRSYLPDLDLILLDNGYVKIQKKIIGIHKFTKYISLNPNVNLLEARNIGYSRATTKWVLFLDDDTFIRDVNFYMRLKFTLSMYPNTGIITCNLVENNLPTFADSIRKVPFFCEGACLINKDSLGKIILYKSARGMYGENLDLIFRTLNNNLDLLLDPKLLVVHEPEYSKRSNAYHLNRIQSHLTNSTLTYFIYLPFLDSVILAIGLFAIYTLQFPRNIRLIIPVGCSIINILAGVFASLSNRSLISAAARSKFYFYSTNNISLNHEPPQNYSVFKFVYNRMKTFNQSLTPWNARETTI